MDRLEYHRRSIGLQRQRHPRVRSDHEVQHGGGARWIQTSGLWYAGRTTVEGWGDTLQADDSGRDL